MPVLAGEPRRMKNAAGAWLASQDAHPNAAGARRLGLRVVDGEGAARASSTAAADLTVILDPEAHPFLETEEALQLLRVGQTVVFARLDNPVTPSWPAGSCPPPSLACNAGTFTSSTGAVQRFAPAFAPPGEARPLWLTLAALARELGVEALDLPSPADDLRPRWRRHEKAFAGLEWDRRWPGSPTRPYRERHHVG